MIASDCDIYGFSRIRRHSGLDESREVVRWQNKLDE